ncbi:hypothetical protein NDU88_004215 [Pleurodeles waltl]|uniref:Uncharacterized protein n=1 Tax=Pleurodeles waltl TaxID=8319 RepID=A0AAV7NJ69_PLEWA|nr:hypothetical protein NDU88_004215 [Pleurodeles waltl]
MAANRACQNAVRFSTVEDVKRDVLLFSRSGLQKELGFRPDQIDYLFAFPGAARLEPPFTPHQSRGRSREDVEEEEEELIRLGLEEERLALQPGLSLSEAKVDITVEKDTSGEGASVLAGKQAGAVDEAGTCNEPNEGASPGAPDQPIMAPTPDLNLGVQSQQTSSKTTREGVAQHHLSAVERNDIVSAGGSSLISTTGAALDAPLLQPVPLSAPQPLGTVMDDSLYVTPEEVEWGKDDILVEEEVESAMDVSNSLKRKEKEGDDTEETGFESNDSRDLCAQDDRRNSQAVTGEDAFTPVIKRKTKKRNRKFYNVYVFQIFPDASLGEY